MMSRLSYIAMAITMSIPVLAGCGADPAPLSDHSLTELCERPEQFLADVWEFAEPVVGTPGVTDKDHPGKIGYGGGCLFDSHGAQVATVSLIRDTPGFLDAPSDADLLAVGQHTVKNWNSGSTALKFETVMGGWQASITITSGSDLATGEPAAADAQIEATATELVEILAEFKGPDFTPTPH